MELKRGIKTVFLVIMSLQSRLTNTNFQIDFLADQIHHLNVIDRFCPHGIYFVWNQNEF